VKCRRAFPVEWRSGEWDNPECGKRLREVWQAPFTISRREFDRREAVPVSNLQKLGMTKAYGWLVAFNSREEDETYQKQFRFILHVGHYELFHEQFAK
jgi:hypothetical protein